VPVSDISNIEPILREVVRLQPKRIYEAGIGFGKYGALCREVLEAVDGRCRPDQWQIEINGVDGFPAYNNPLWATYNNVVTADFRNIYGQISGYDVVLVIDSIEHVEKAEALTILYHLAQANRHLIVSVPVGDCPQDACFSNEYERHRSTWKGPGEFAAFNYRVLHSGVCVVVSIQGVR
jgi:hypothetical protein